MPWNITRFYPLINYYVPDIFWLVCRKHPYLTCTSIWNFLSHPSKSPCSSTGLKHTRWCWSRTWVPRTHSDNRTGRSRGCWRTHRHAHKELLADTHPHPGSKKDNIAILYCTSCCFWTVWLCSGLASNTILNGLLFWKEEMERFVPNFDFLRLGNQHKANRTN